VLLCVLTLYASTTIFFFPRPVLIHYLNAAAYFTFGVLFIFRMAASSYFGQVSVPISLRRLHFLGILRSGLVQSRERKGTSSNNHCCQMV
jgi:hypothetical protein